MPKSGRFGNVCLAQFMIYLSVRLPITPSQRQFQMTNLPNIPCSPRVEEHTARHLAVGAPASIDDTSSPVPPVQDQRRDGVAEGDLVRATRQTVEHDQHGPGVVGANLGEGVVGEVGGPRGQRVVDILVRLRREVDGKGALVRLVVGVKDLSAVVDWRAVLPDGSPHGLDIAIEEERVELARRSTRLDDL